MNRNTHHSKTQYIHTSCDHSNWVSVTTHHHRATQPHSHNKYYQSEVRRNTHHCSANYRSNLEIYWLDLADIHFSPKSQFVLVSIKTILQSDPSYTSFRVQSQMNVIKIHQREWSVPRFILKCPYFTAAIVPCWRWALADLTPVLFFYISAGTALKCTRSIASIISSVYSTSAK